MPRLLILCLAFGLFSANLYAEEFDPKALPAVKKALGKATTEVARNRKAYDEANEKAFDEAKETISKEVDKLSKAGKLEEAVAVKKFSENFSKQVLAKGEKATAPPNPALQGAVAWNGHKYKYFADKVTWPDAKAKCEEMGGHLVTVDNQAEQEFVVQLLGRVSQDTQYASWLGITCQDKPRQWQTVSGGKLAYQNWHAGEPNGPDSPFGALAMHFGGQWDDVPSHHLFAFICEWDD